MQLVRKVKARIPCHQEDRAAVDVLACKQAARLAWHPQIPELVAQGCVSFAILIMAEKMSRRKTPESMGPNFLAPERPLSSISGA